MFAGGGRAAPFCSGAIAADIVAVVVGEFLPLGSLSRPPCPLAPGECKLVGSSSPSHGLRLPPVARKLLDVLARDTHYKYLVIMLISSGTGFVIANWVGWQYYRNS